jgi:hypothetical protein
MVEIIQCADARQSITFCLAHFSVLSGLRFNQAVLLVFLRQDESA